MLQDLVSCVNSTRSKAKELAETHDTNLHVQTFLSQTRTSCEPQTKTSRSTRPKLRQAMIDSKTASSAEEATPRQQPISLRISGGALKKKKTINSCQCSPPTRLQPPARYSYTPIDPECCRIGVNALAALELRRIGIG